MRDAPHPALDHALDDTLDAVSTLARAGLPAPLARPESVCARQAEGLSDVSRRLPSDPDLFAALLDATGPAPIGRSGGPRRRLLQRVSASAEGARTMHTLRHADTVATALAPGVTARELYRAAPGRARRPGEPEAVALVELAPGTVWRGPARAHGSATGRPLLREWLVVRGRVQTDGQAMAALDYHVLPADADACTFFSPDGALLFLREAPPVAPMAPVGALGYGPDLTTAFTQSAETAEWADYAPGIKRRVLWRQGLQAAMLYHALPGAAVPHHGHRHDEECLMLAGDFFLDEVLLRPLDYQIAPAGSEHHTSNTDTGVLIYAHGDIDLDLR